MVELNFFFHYHYYYYYFYNGKAQNFNFFEMHLTICDNIGVRFKYDIFLCFNVSIKSKIRK